MSSFLNRPISHIMPRLLLFSLLYIVTVISSITLATPVKISEKQEEQGAKKQNNGGKKELPSISVVISKKICRQLVLSHKANPDVAYTPDHAVPADVTPPQDFGFSDVMIEVLLPLGSFVSNPTHFSSAAQTAIGESQIHGGQITVSKEGEVRINGHLAQNKTRTHLEKMCRTHYPDV